jgi:hypothetical protein
MVTHYKSNASTIDPATVDLNIQENPYENPNFATDQDPSKAFR